MDLTDTLFILGAGASKPYGYPTAEELRNELISKYGEILRYGFANFEIGDINYFKRVEKLLEQFDLSNNKSIDIFLTRNKNSVDIELGVGLIWLSMLWYENLSSYRAKERNEDWYFEFFNELTSGMINKGNLSELSKNKVHFITFNYDRSLENFLYVSFLNSFSLSHEEAKKILEGNLVFHHVYGKIANLEWQSTENVLKYKTNPTKFNFSAGARSINLIYDERKINKEIQELVSKTHKILFLGFGFDEANINFLNLKELLNPSHQIHATALGIYDSKISLIKYQISRGQVGIRDHHIHFYKESGNLDLLRKILF